MTHIDIPAALRNAAQHVREHRTLDITAALVVSARDVRGLASVTAAFSQWVETTTGESVELHAWARRLPTSFTLADYLSFAAEDLAPCEWCDQQPCADRAEHDRLRRQSEVEHWRKASAARAVGVPAPSALGSGQVAAADGEVDLPLHRSASHPNHAPGVSAGVDTGRSAPARGDHLGAYAAFGVKVDRLLTEDRAVEASDSELLERVLDDLAVLRFDLAATDSGPGRQPAPSSPAGGTGPATGAGPVPREERS